MLEFSSVYNRFSVMGDNVDTPDGSCLKIETTYPSPGFLGITEEDVRRRLLTDLTLVQGIGPVRARELIRSGKKNICDLFDTRWKEDAENVSEIIENGSVSDIFTFFAAIQRKSEPALLGLIEKSGIVFFDIETLGMWNAPVVLLGCGKCIGNSIEVTQYLIRNLKEELPALLLAAEILNKSSSIVTYNGRIFDIPYVNDRLELYGEPSLYEKLHVDLLYPTRKLFRNLLSDCRLETVESAIPSLNRGEDIPGSLVPFYYSTYLATGRMDILYPIVDHNRIDVANLAYLLDYEQKR